MSDLLSDCILTIDTREQNQKRIESVKSFIESHNGAVELSKLDLCDYKIEGLFREKPVCIGIEAKSLTDFASSYLDLPDKLARSFELYNDVALFVEIPQIKTSSEDNFHATILNESVPDGSANVLQYAVLYNSLASWQNEGVHVRQLQSEMFWGYAIASVLISVTKDTHRGLEITKVKDFRTQYLNILSKFDGIGLKTAQKIVIQFPNLHWLASADESNIQDTIGKVTGSKLYKFLRNQELCTPEWMAGNIQSNSAKESQQETVENKPESDNLTKNVQTPKKPKKSLKSNPEQSTANELNTVTELYTEVPRQLPEAPDEFKANPRFKDVTEFIRRRPRKTEEIGEEFGFSPDYCLKALYALKDEHKKIWFNKSTMLWEYGLDKNPAPVTADKEIEVL